MSLNGSSITDGSESCDARTALVEFSYVKFWYAYFNQFYTLQDRKTHDCGQPTQIPNRVGRLALFLEIRWRPQLFFSFSKPSFFQGFGTINFAWKYLLLTLSLSINSCVLAKNDFWHRTWKWKSFIVSDLDHPRIFSWRIDHPLFCDDLQGQVWILVPSQISKALRLLRSIYQVLVLTAGIFVCKLVLGRPYCPYVHGCLYCPRVTL